jgi:S-adenosylmethionine:tRNA ribosyltransferase-isomerase
VETHLFDYVLPDAQIAQHPSATRDGGRLLVLSADGVGHATFRDWPDLVPSGALVVLNDTRVRKARILGTREGTGGKVEILLVRRAEAQGECPKGATAMRSPGEEWFAIGRASHSLRAGSRVVAGTLAVHVLGQEDGLLRVRIEVEGDVEAAIDREGHVPLPPYIRRADQASDTERYQTLFAREKGSAAAPTAGLHVTRDTLARLRARGVRIAHVTLHVGLGTFQPVGVPDLDLHRMHGEVYEVSADLVSEVDAARERGAPVVAVGTTVVRAL